LRGYALVTGPDGHVVGGRAIAAQLAEMRLEFHDGTLQVSPAGSPRKPARPTRTPGADPTTRQGDLF